MAILSKSSLTALINSTIVAGASVADLRTALIDMIDSYQDFIDTYTTTERDALTPAIGWVIYNTTNERVEWYDGSNWISIDRDATQLNSYSNTGNIKQSDRVILADTTGGNFTLTLPAAADCEGKEYTFIKTIAANTLTISAQSGETINGTLTTTISSQYGTKKLICDGSEWFIISSI